MYNGGGGEIIGTLFFKKSTLFGRYRVLLQFFRLGAGSVENYVMS